MSCLGNISCKALKTTHSDAWKQLLCTWWESGVGWRVCYVLLQESKSELSLWWIVLSKCLLQYNETYPSIGLPFLSWCTKTPLFSSIIPTLGYLRYILRLQLSIPTSILTSLSLCSHYYLVLSVLDHGMYHKSWGTLWLIHVPLYGLEEDAQGVKLT